MADKTLMDKINQGRQYRSMAMNIEKRASDDEEKKYIVKGYATTFNEPYTLYSGEDFEYREQVAPDAFKDCDMSDVILQFDHAGKVYARGSNGTLKLEIDDHGLLVTADLSSTENTRSLYEDIAAGLITKMSFGFTVTEDDELRETIDGRDVYTRTVKSIGKLYDVSAVSLPANDGTEISARGLVDGVIAKRMAENAQEEEQKRIAEEEAKKKAEEETKEREMRERERLRALALLNI